MDTVYGFHDSCLKELKYISGAYVNEKLSMIPVNKQKNIEHDLFNGSLKTICGWKCNLWG